MNRLAKLLLAFSALLAAGQIQAENLFYNGSFELGKCGYSFDRFYRPKANPGLERNLPVLDESTKTEGSCSLRVDNPYQEECRVQCKDFILPANAKVNISFFAKGENGLTVQTDFRAPQKPINLGGMYAHLESGWKQYSFSIQTGKEQGGGYVLRFLRAPAVAGSFWLDDIRVWVEGEKDQFKGVEAGVEVSSLLYDAGETVSASLHVRNTSEQKFSARVPIQLFDEYFKTKKTVFTADVQLEPGEKRVYPFSFTADRIGAFSLIPEHSALRICHGNVTVIGKYTPRKLDFAHDACVGFNGGTMTKLVGETDELCYPASNMNPDDRFAMLSRLGVRLLRAHDTGYSIGSWYLFEPQPGVYNTEKLDFDSALYKKYGMEMIAVPLNSDFTKRQYAFEHYRFRDWLIQRCEAKKYHRSIQYYPPKEEFRRFIREFAKRSAGKIRLFEIFNEPQMCMDVSRYMEYLKIAYEEIKREIPDSYILAFCSTSDRGQSIEGFTMQGLEMGGAKYCDAISLHPYSFPQLNSPYPADAQLADFKKLVTPYNVRKIWNTELYYLLQSDFSDHYTSSQFEPHHASARFLIDLGEGVEQGCPVHVDSIWKKSLHQRFLAYTSLNALDGTFSATGVVYNPLARFFEGARPVDKIRYPNNVICYVFTRDGSEIAALWNYGSRRDLSADLSAFEVMDLFGNPVEAGVLPLTAAQYYIRPKNGATTFGDRLKKLDIRMEQIIQALPEARLLRSRDGKAALRVSLFNTGSREVECRLGLSGRLAGMEISTVKVAAGKSVTLDLPCTVKAGDGETVLGLFVDGKLLRVPLKVTEIPAAEAGEVQQFASADKKVSGSFSVARRDNGVEFTIRVNDATDSGAEPNRRAFWEQDCVELFFDRLPGENTYENPGYYTKDVFRLFIMPRHKGNNVHFMDHPIRTTPMDLPCKVENDADGYSIVITVPESLLPADGREFGFELKVDDAESASGKTVREAFWSNGSEPHMNRLEFGLIKGQH